MSGLVRWPLLLKYGGVYADVGMIQIGDLDRLWCETVGDPASPPSRFEVLSYNVSGVKERSRWARGGGQTVLVDGIWWVVREIF